jgi:hypothetical protein
VASVTPPESAALYWATPIHELPTSITNARQASMPGKYMLSLLKDI